MRTHPHARPDASDDRGPGSYGPLTVPLIRARRSAVVGLVLLGVLLGLAGSAQLLGGDGSAARLSGALVLLIGIHMVLLITRESVSIDTDAVTVRTQLKTTRVPLQEAHSFVAAGLRRVDGSLARSLVTRGRQGQLESLQERLREVRPVTPELEVDPASRDEAWAPALGDMLGRRAEKGLTSRLTAARKVWLWQFVGLGLLAGIAAAFSHVSLPQYVTLAGAVYAVVAPITMVLVWQGRSTMTSHLLELTHPAAIRTVYMDRASAGGYLAFAPLFGALGIAVATDLVVAVPLAWIVSIGIAITLAPTMRDLRRLDNKRAERLKSPITPIITTRGA